MDKNREGRRVAMATPNGLPWRKHRTSSLSDSPEDDGALGLQETARFRDRTVKRDRDREKERSDRDRDRMSRSKRRREDGVRDSSEESFFDEDQEDPDDVPVRVMPPNPASVSTSSSPSSALTSMRKSYPPPSKIFRAAPSWKAPDEINGFSIPRKARSATTKRSHDYWSPPAVGGEKFLLPASSSLVRPGVMASSAVASPSPAPLSPSSSSISMKKKFKANNGHKQRPPKSSTKPPSSIQDDIEIEVAEVLYGLMRQSHGPSKQEMMSNASARWDYKEVSRSSTGDSKSRASSPISKSISAPAQDLPQTSNSSAPPLSAVATKRKRPHPVCHQEKIFSAFASQSSPNSTASKIEPYVFTKQEVHSQRTEKNSVLGAEIGRSSFNLVKSHELQMACKTARSEPVAEVFSSEDNRSLAVDKSQGQDTVTVEEVPRLKKETVNDHVEYTSIQQSVIMTATTGEKETHREEKYEIDLMASPQQSRSSPEREEDMDHQYHQDLMATDRRAVLESKPIEGGKIGRVVSGGNTDSNTDIVEKVSKYSLTGAEEGETQKPVLNKARNSEIHFDLERVDNKASPSSADDNKLNQPLQKLPLNPSRDDTSFDKPAQRSSLPLSMSLPAGWPPGLPPMGYLAPLQGAVSMDGRPMPPTNIEPPNFLFTQPQPGRCATHWYIAKNIQSHMQLMNSYPFWPTEARAAPLFGAKPCNLNVVPTADVNPAQDKGQALAYFPGPQPAVKDKDAQPTTNIADGPQKKRFYQVLPPGGPSNMLHGPANLFFPLGQQQQQQHVVVANSTKSPVQAGIAASMGMSTSVQTSPATMSFNYPNMHANETQYLAILANGAYQFPIPTHISSAAQAYRGVHPQVMPFFNGSYYPSQILHPSQLQQQQQQPSPSSQPTQTQQNHQNPSISTASSSSHKHPQNQQQKPQGNDNSTNPGLQTFSTPTSTARPPNVSFYGQNFALPFNPSNFALMTPPNSLSGATTGASKSSMAPQAFAMSFSSMNGATTAPGPDFTSIAQNHAFLQNNYQLMAAAAAAAAATQAAAHQKKKKKNDHRSEDGKSGAPDDGRKGAAAKAIISNATAATSSQQQQQFNTQLQKQQEHAISNSTAEFPNALSGFPQSMSLGQQQQGTRPQQGHNNTQISFWGNPKVAIAAAASQGQQGADATQSPSSVSKGGHTWKHKDDHILVNG